MEELIKLKVYRVLHEDVKQNIYYYFSKLPNKDKFVLSIYYFDSFSSDETWPDKIKHFLGNSEEELLTEADNWIKENIGKNFERIPLP